jgi:hypothetical protein
VKEKPNPKYVMKEKSNPKYVMKEKSNPKYVISQGPTMLQTLYFTKHD